MEIDNKSTKAQTLDQYGIWVKTSVDTLEEDIAIESDEITNGKQESLIARNEEFLDNSDFPEFPDVSDMDTPDFSDKDFDLSLDDISDEDILMEDSIEDNAILDDSTEQNLDDDNFFLKDTPANSITSDEDFSGISNEEVFMESTTIDNNTQDGDLSDIMNISDISNEDDFMEETFPDKTDTGEEFPDFTDITNNDVVMEETTTYNTAPRDDSPEVLSQDFSLTDEPIENTQKQSNSAGSDQFSKFEQEYASLNNEIHMFRDQLLKEVSQIKQQLIDLQKHSVQRTEHDTAERKEDEGFFAETSDDEIILLTDQELDEILDTHEEEELLTTDSYEDPVSDDSLNKETVIAEASSNKDDFLPKDDVPVTAVDKKVDKEESSADLSQMKLGDDGEVFSDLEEISLDSIIKYASEANVNLDNDVEDNDSEAQWGTELENELNETAGILDDMDNLTADKIDFSEEFNDEIVIPLRDDNDPPLKTDILEDAEKDTPESFFEPWEVVEDDKKTQNEISDLNNLKSNQSLKLPDIDDEISPQKPASDSDSPNTLTGAVQQNDFKNTLQYLDGLLDFIPRGKYQEFVRSEHFGMYKKILEELGIAS